MRLHMKVAIVDSVYLLMHEFSLMVVVPNWKRACTGRSPIEFRYTKKVNKIEFCILAVLVPSRVVP